MGPLKSHISLTLISPPAFIFTESWVLKKSQNDTYLSDSLYVCVWAHADFSTDRSECALVKYVCVYVRPCDGRESRNGL